MTDEILTKRCSDCETEKPVDQFYRYKEGGYLFRRCKVCHVALSKVQAKKRPRTKRNEYQKRYLDSHPEARERERQRRRDRYRNNKEYFLALGSRRRAWKLGGGGSHSEDAWRQLKELFGNRCLCCGQEKKLTRDHVIPLSRQGSDDITNIQPMCAACNKSKFTQAVDYRTREKVVLEELNDVGRLLFETERPQATEQFRKHKKESRFTGVFFVTKTKNWRVIITVNKERFDLGRYPTEIQAAEAYNRAAVLHIGQDAWQNDLSLALD